MVHVHKCSQIRNFGGSRLVAPILYLKTDYYCNTDVASILGVKDASSQSFEVCTDIVLDESKTRQVKFVIAHRGKTMFTQKGDDLEILQQHCEATNDLESRLGNDVAIEEFPLGQSPYGYIAVVAKRPENGREVYTLTTRLRAPKKYLKEGLVVEDEMLFDVAVVSEARFAEKGVEKYTCLLRPDSRIVKATTHEERYAKQSIISHHLGAVEGIIAWTKAHYGKRDDIGALLYLEDNDTSLSTADYWDIRESGLMESAEKIAKAILEQSPLAPKVKIIIMYGSMARHDKCPNDIDMLLLVDSKDSTLDPTKYYIEQKKEPPIEYNVAAVTNGLINELGIREEIARIGVRMRASRSLDLDGDYFAFSKVGGGLDMNAVSTEFFSSAELIERLMRIAFTPDYFQKVLMQGIVFNYTFH